MLAYRIEDMTCGGCVRAIRAAVARVAPQAIVEADVEARRLRIDGADDGAAIGAVLEQAGFHPVAERIEAAAPAPAQTSRGGCGGGHCGCAGR